MKTNRIMPIGADAHIFLTVGNLNLDVLFVVKWDAILLITNQKQIRFNFVQGGIMVRLGPVMRTSVKCAIRITAYSLHSPAFPVANQRDISSV